MRSALAEKVLPLKRRKLSYIGNRRGQLMFRRQRVGNAGESRAQLVGGKGGGMQSERYKHHEPGREPSQSATVNAPL